MEKETEVKSKEQIEKTKLETTKNMEDAVPKIKLNKVDFGESANVDNSSDNSTELKEEPKLSKKELREKKKQERLEKKEAKLEKREKRKARREKFAKFLNLKEKEEKKPLTDDIKYTRKYAWLAYILFFIPLCINKESQFVRFHANEGLEINFVDFIAVICLLVGSLIKNTTIITVLLAVVGVCLLVLTTLTKILMIFKTLKGEQKESPWFFRWKIFK